MVDEKETERFLAVSQGNEEANHDSSLVKPQTTSILESLDDRFNLKKMARDWRPLLEFALRVLLLATFFDDSFHTLMDFSEHAQKVNPVALAIGLTAQIVGAGCLLAAMAPDYATMALIGWLIVQPILYQQLLNFEMLSESISLIGGLLLLRAHLLCDFSDTITPLIGRLLLPAMYLHAAVKPLLSLKHFNSLSSYTVHAVLVVTLASGCVLVALGLKSRRVAVAFGLVNILVVFYQHPFFRMIFLENQDWKYDPSHMPIPNSVELPEDVSTSDLELAQVYNVHRYYFFLGLSTSGALFTLASTGPGQIALDSNESLLPLQRGHD